MTSLFSVGYFAGLIIAAGICFATNSILTDWGWRIPSLLQVAPPLAQIIFVFFLPESPRWLVSKDRSDEAMKILVDYHAEGDRDSELVRAEMAQIQTAILVETGQSKKSWLGLVATVGMRRRLLTTCMLGLFTQWSGGTLISYYLGDLLQLIGHSSSHFKQTINVSNACWALVCSFAASMLVKRYRRRQMYLACAASLLVVFVSWTISMERAITGLEANSPNKGAGVASIFFIFAYAPCYCLALNALTYSECTMPALRCLLIVPAFLVELWPYAERSRGIAIFQLFSRSAEFFTTFVNPVGLENISWKYLITYCCFLGFEVVYIYFMFPETSGRTLEEVAFCKSCLGLVVWR